MKIIKKMKNMVQIVLFFIKFVEDLILKILLKNIIIIVEMLANQRFWK